MRDSELDDVRPVCSIVIPGFNHASLTKTCVDSILANPSVAPSEVIVVDDASCDDTPEVLAAYGDRICVITHRTNVGYARSCNDGAAAATTERYLVFLNNDTVVTPGWLDSLIAYADAHPRAAIVGAKLLYPNGTVQHAGTVITRRRTPVHAYVGFPSDHPAVNRSRPFQLVTAACMLVRRDLFDSVSGFDPSYHNNYEDVDLCLRVGELGHEVHYCHESVVYHHESATRHPEPERYKESLMLYDRRWRHRVRPDDLELYAEDGLLKLIYEPRMLTVKVSPLLACVAETPSVYGDQLRAWSSECFRLEKENLLLTERVEDLERARAANSTRCRPRLTALAARAIGVLDRPVEFVRHPSERWRRPAALARWMLRPAYRVLSRATRRVTP